MAAGRIVVKKRTTGEVGIYFTTKKDPIFLGTRNEVDLMKLGVTLDDVRKSNLRSLLRINAVDLV
jgi:hypothetical protein